MAVMYVSRTDPNVAEPVDVVAPSDVLRFLIEVAADWSAGVADHNVHLFCAKQYAL